MALNAIHPGEHLAEELKELGMSAAELARQLDVPLNAIHGPSNVEIPFRISVTRPDVRQDLKN